MPDPIDELEGFTMPTVNPLPAAEVRRRGDRIRRRNHTVAALGGVAAVVTLAVPFAVFAGNQTPADPQPMSPSRSVEWVQQIPDGFPLSDGLPASTRERDGYEQRHVDVCDGQGWSAEGASDVRQAVYTGENEGSWNRALALYPSDRDAQRALQVASDSAAACASDTEDGQGRWVELVPSVAGDESIAYANHMSDAGDMFVVRLVRVGNAILQDSPYSFAGGNARMVQREVDLVAEKSAGVVEAMCVFSATPCSAQESPTATGEGAVSAIPDGFPLGRGLESTEGEPLLGPSATADGVPALELCGRPVWPAAGVERLAVTATGVEYRESRELVTFSSTADITSPLGTLREAVGACADATVQDAAPSGADDAVTFVEMPAEGLGGEVFQFVRVGRALYATYQSGEWSPETIGSGVEQLTGRTEAMLPDLCPWTETGC